MGVDAAGRVADPVAVAGPRPEVDEEPRVPAPAVAPDHGPVRGWAEALDRVADAVRAAGAAVGDDVLSGAVARSHAPDDGAVGARPEPDTAPIVRQRAE